MLHSSHSSSSCSTAPLDPSLLLSTENKENLRNSGLPDDSKMNSTLALLIDPDDTIGLGEPTDNRNSLLTQEPIYFNTFYVIHPFLLIFWYSRCALSVARPLLKKGDTKGGMTSIFERPHQNTGKQGFRYFPIPST